MPMANNRMGCFAVVGFVPVTWRLYPIVEVIADPIARENLRRYHSGTDVSAVIAQHKAVKAAFLRRPVFARRDHDGSPRSSSRPAEKEGVNPGTIKNRGIRQLPRTFFNHDAGDGASGEEQSD
jgi:hypothetical protein